MLNRTRTSLFVYMFMLCSVGEKQIAPQGKAEYYITQVSWQQHVATHVTSFSTCLEMSRLSVLVRNWSNLNLNVRSCFDHYNCKWTKHLDKSFKTFLAFFEAEFSRRTELTPLFTQKRSISFTLFPPCRLLVYDEKNKILQLLQHTMGYLRGCKVGRFYNTQPDICQ